MTHLTDEIIGIVIPSVDSSLPGLVISLAVFSIAWRHIGGQPDRCQYHRGQTADGSGDDDVSIIVSARDGIAGYPATITAQFDRTDSLLRPKGLQRNQAEDSKSLGLIPSPLSPISRINTDLFGDMAGLSSTPTADRGKGWVIDPLQLPVRQTSHALGQSRR